LSFRTYKKTFHESFNRPNNENNSGRYGTSEVVKCFPSATTLRFQSAASVFAVIVAVPSLLASAAAAISNSRKNN
jgi:hypothetical protein